MRLILFSLLFLGLSVRADHSLAPLVGYVPTYGGFGGVGHFWQRGLLRSELFAVLSTSGAMQAEFRFRNNGPWGTDDRLQFKRGFEKFYGMDEANSARSAEMDFTSYLIQLEGTRHLGNQWRAGLTLAWALRNGEAVPPYFRSRHQAWSVGLVARWNEQFRVDVERSFLLDGASNLRIRVEARPGVELGDGLRLVFRAKVGTTVGSWDPLTEFSLGGSDRLRGYHTQRFRGKHLYLLESALRFPLWRQFRGSVFAGVGDAFLVRGAGPKPAAGVGIHFALPPDEVQVVRLDVGWGTDQWGAYLDFGLPF